MPLTLSQPHDDLTFMTALSETRAQQQVSFLAGSPEGVLADYGCGWAELLLRAVDAAPQLTGVGIDQDTDALEHGRTLATERGLADRVTLIAADARQEGPAAAAAAICIGASHIWSDDQDGPMSYEAALAALRDKLPRGGRLVYGEGIWTTPPTDAAIAALGNRKDEFVDLPALVDLAVAAGFTPDAVGEASQDEWDEFESGYSACYTRWLAEHDADDPDAAKVRELAARQRDGYLRGYRGVLGLAYLNLMAV